MINDIRTYKNSILYKVVVLCLLLSFGLMSVAPQEALSQTLAPAISNTLIPLSPAFTPTLVRGIRVYPDNPLKFDFIVDSGDSGLQGDELKSESEKLIRYFLASLTLPENDLWVNLSPYEKDRIVPAELGTTEMGIDMLAQDYLLKQITASLTNPDSDLGKEFWQKIYKQSYEKFGTTNVPVDTFNKVWIMPDKAEVYVQEDKAFVVESRLKVMLESDYLAREKSKEDRREKIEDGKNNDKTTANKSPDSLDSKTFPSSIVHSPSSDISSSIVREVFIPVLEKEVNEGKNFAQLRQIYNSIILSYWYKTNLKNSILNKVYADKRKVKGLEGQRNKGIKNGEKFQVSSVKNNLTPNTLNMTQSDASNPLILDSSDPQSEVDSIYQQYLDTFKKGVCNMMKVEYDPYTKKNIPRKYFAGGVTVMNLNTSFHESQEPSHIFINYIRKSGAQKTVYEISVQARAPEWTSTSTEAPFFQNPRVASSDIPVTDQSIETRASSSNEIFEQQSAPIALETGNSTPVKAREPDQAQNTSWQSLPTFEAMRYSRDFEAKKVDRYRGETLGRTGNVQLELDGTIITIDHHLIDSGVTRDQWQSLLGEWYQRLSPADQEIFHRQIKAAGDKGGLVIGVVPREEDKWSSKYMMNYESGSGYFGINEYVLSVRMDPSLFAALFFDTLLHAADRSGETPVDTVFQVMGGEGDVQSALKTWKRRAETARYNVSQHSADVFIEYAREEYRLISHGDDELRTVYSELREIFDNLLVSAGYDPGSFHFHLADYSDANAFVVSFSNHIVLNIGLLWEFFYAIQESRSQGDPEKFFMFFKEHIALILAHEISHITQDRDKVNKGEAPKPETLDEMKRKMERGRYDWSVGYVQGEVDVYVHEIDADRRALEIMDGAGYSVGKAQRPFEMLRKAMDLDGRKENFFGNHPLLGERIRNILKAVKPNYFKHYRAPSQPFSEGFSLEFTRWEGQAYQFERTRVRTYHARLMNVRTTAQLLELIRDAKTPKELEMASTYGVYSLLLFQVSEYQNLNKDSAALKEFTRLHEELRQILTRYMEIARSEILRQGLDRPDSRGRPQKRNWWRLRNAMASKKLNRGLFPMSISSQEYGFVLSMGYKKDHSLRIGQSIIESRDMTADQDQRFDVDNRLLMWFLEYLLNNRDWRPVPIVRDRISWGLTEVDNIISYSKPVVSNSSYLERGSDEVRTILKPLTEDLLPQLEKEIAPFAPQIKKVFEQIYQDMGLNRELKQLGQAAAERLEALKAEETRAEDGIQTFYSKVAMRAFFGEVESMPVQVQGLDHGAEKKFLIDSIKKLPKEDLARVFDHPLLGSVWRFDLIHQDEEGRRRQGIMMQRERFPHDVQRKGAGWMTSDFLLDLEGVIKARADEFSVRELIHLLNRILLAKEVGWQKYVVMYHSIGVIAVEQIIDRLQAKTELITDDLVETLLETFKNFPELISESQSCQNFFLDLLIFNPSNYARYRQDIMLIFSKDRGAVSRSVAGAILSGFARGKLDQNEYFSLDRWGNDPGKVFFEFYVLLQKDPNILGFIEGHFGFTTPVEKLKYSESLFKALNERPERQQEFTITDPYNDPATLSNLFFQYTERILEEAATAEIMEHANKFIVAQALELGLGEDFIVGVSHLNQQIRQWMYLFGLGGFVSMDTFYDQLDDAISGLSAEDLEGLFTYLNALTPLQTKRRFAQKYFLTPMTWSEYLVPLSYYVIHKKFNFDLSLGQNASFLIRSQNPQEKYKHPHNKNSNKNTWFYSEENSSVSSVQADLDNPYQILIGEFPSKLYRPPPRVPDFTLWTMWIQDLLRRRGNVPVHAVLAGLISGTNSTDRLHFSSVERKRLLKIFSFVQDNPQYDFDHWVAFAKDYMPSSAFRDLFLYYVLWDKHLASALGIRGQKKWTRFYDLDRVLSGFSNKQLANNQELQAAVRSIAPLMIEDRFMKQINGVTSGLISAWIADSNAAVNHQEKEMIEEYTLFSSFSKRLSHKARNRLARFKVMFDPILFTCLFGSFYLLNKFWLRIYSILHLEKIPGAMKILPFLSVLGGSVFAESPLTKYGSPFHLPDLPVKELERLMDISTKFRLMKELYAPLRLSQTFRSLLFVFLSLAGRLSRGRIKAEFNEEGNIHSQIDLVTAYPYRDMILKKAQSAGRAWEALARETQEYFARPSYVRDEFLVAAAESAFQEASLSASDKLRAMEQLSALMYRDFFRDKFRLRALELALGIKEKEEGQSLTFEQEMDLVFQYFTDFSFTRDDILLEIMERAGIPEEDKDVREHLLLLQENAIKDKVKNKITAENKIRETIQKASNLDKEEFALWIMGLRKEKPVAVMEIEFFSHTDLGYLKEIFSELGSTKYSSIGTNAKKDLMESLFGGKKGLMRDPERMAHFLNVVFEKSVPAGMADRKSLKKIFRTVFQHLDEDKTLEVISALAGKMKSDGTSSVPELIKTFFESMGLVGIKLAQIISHSDIRLDSLVKKALQELSSSADPFGKRFVFQLLRLALGDDFGKHFAYVGSSLGSASIKLVYRVVLADGKRVVMKIKRPHIDKVLDVELETLEKILDALGRSGLNIPKNMGKQVASYLREEVDFYVERANQKRYREILANRTEELFVGSHRIFLRSAENYTELDELLPESLRGQAIFEEEMHGVPLNEDSRLEDELGLTKDEIRQLKKKIFGELMEEMFVDGFFHADPHGGNIWINKRDDGSLELVFLDLGSMGRNDAVVTRADLESVAGGRDAVVNEKMFVLEEETIDQDDFVLNPELSAEDFGADEFSLTLKALWEKGLAGKSKRMHELAQWLCYMALHPGQLPQIPDGRILEATFFKKVGYIIRAVDQMEIPGLIFSKLGYKFPDKTNEQMTALRLASEGKWDQIEKQDFTVSLKDRGRGLFVKGKGIVSNMFKKKDDGQAKVAEDGKFNSRTVGDEEMAVKASKEVGKVIKNTMLPSDISDQVLDFFGRYLTTKRRNALADTISPSGSGKGSQATSGPGGIDFKSDNINLVTQGQAIDFAMPQNMSFENLQEIKGLIPVIINIVPVTDFMGLLGLGEEEKLEVGS